MMTMATELAKRITQMRYDDLPGEAVHWAKVSLIDTVACALAGAHEDCATIVARVLGAGRGGGPSLIWGTHARTTPLDAAAINGTAVHALDYDDCNNTLGGHPSVPVLSALIPLAESLGASGKDVLLAFISGFETQARIAMGVNLHHYRKGWHPTATLGIFGAAAGSARLLGLDAQQTATALAIAVSLSSGVKANFGTMTKPLHAGHCARNGLYAALLAREGFTANHGAFEHHHGFLEVFNGAGHYDASKILEHWADPLDILAPGVGLKQYPCCASTHSAIDAAILLRKQHGLTPERIAKVESVTHAAALAHTDRPRPASALDAKFSVQYCVARALMHGKVVFEHFDEQAICDPDVSKLLERVEARPHSYEPKSMFEHYQGMVKVTTTDGQTYSARVDQPLRGPQNLAPPDQSEPKFRDCAARVLRADAIPAVLEMLRRFESLADIREFTDQLARAVREDKDARAAA
jgi:2-methylcitrate dehydratase PrpD